MRLRPTYTSQLIDSIKAVYFATYGKHIHINDNELATYLIGSGFENKEAAIAHFRRAIQYYKERYHILPTLRHLTSPKIPVLADIPDWEQALYTSYPEFVPVLVAPNTNKLDAESRVFAWLFTSDADVRTAISFVEEVDKLQGNHEFAVKSMAVVERLIFSMAYRRTGTYAEYKTAISVHNTLKKKYVKLRKAEWNKDKHWSWLVVPDQTFNIFGSSVSFWEGPKLFIDKELAARFFNVSKYSQAHAKAVMTAMMEYAQGREHLLPFLLTAREHLRLTLLEKELWRDEAPRSFPPYPY